MAIIGVIASSTRQGQAVDLGAMFPLQVVTVGTPTSSLTFTNIPNTYAHLQIRVFARSTINGTSDNVYLRFNNDSSSSYRTHQLYGDGSTVASNATGSETSHFNVILPGGTSAANIYGAGNIDILDYANTNKNTTVRTLSGVNQNGVATGFAIMRSGLWVNTAAVSSITLFVGSGNFAQYSQFALYGIKGA